MKKEGQLANEIKKLQYQLSYSEHINREISAQLATCCDKMGITPSKFKQTSDINLLNVQTHLQQLYYVQPLIMCYEETIHLLKTQLQQSQQEAKAIAQNTQKIVNENNFLRKQLESKIQLLSKADNLGFNVNFLNLQNKDLKDKISILQAKIDFLVRKNKQLTEDYEKVKNQNLKLFDKNQIANLQYKAKQDSKIKEAQLINVKSELQILKNQLSNQQSIVADVDQKLNQMDNQIIRLKNELKVAKQQLQNNQTIQERTKQGLQTELLTLRSQLANSQRKEQQLFSKCMSLESQLQDKGNKIHNINVQNSQLQTNNNNMLQMLESYEVKVSSLNKKIKKLETQAKQMDQEKAELLKRAEISEWKLTQKNEESERKEAEWRKQKSRIAKMWQDRLQAMRKSYDIPVSDKQQ